MAWMAGWPLVGFQRAASRGIGASQLRPARPRLHKWHDFQRIRGALPPTGQAEAQARRTRLTRAVHAQGHQKVTLCWPPLQTRALFALSSASGQPLGQSFPFLIFFGRPKLPDGLIDGNLQRTALEARVGWPQVCLQKWPKTFDRWFAWLTRAVRNGQARVSVGGYAARRSGLESRWRLCATARAAGRPKCCSSRPVQQKQLGACIDWPAPVSPACPTSHRLSHGQVK